MNATMLAEHTGVAIRSKLPSEEVIGRSEIESMVRKIMVVGEERKNQSQGEDAEIMC
ncbi:hypothetical protein COLO4_22125 [Corchorus olitorius]|uniref:Uncharacterized protein n=1 Tax=Corchorus olitorius TaxID=93759 RepID=A0A1R3IP21_9ROSI|nr:hypothetical protein COLO4_22125 [Corchorus olitorius]